MTDPLLPGDPRRVGAYELLTRLGEGGQGSVYLGRDPQGREVAVKLLHARLSRDPDARRRFVRELEVAERVSGFCTARVLDADIQGDQPYIVSEYVRGPSLTDLVRTEGPMDAGALLRLAIGTATALAAIHRAGIVHRDFKPPNVLIGQGGPRVIDFGIARALDSSAITMTSQIVGTPAYMAPEQVAGGAIGPAADVFAWGGTMLFAATGRLPFGGDSIPAVMHRVLNAEADVSVLPGPLAQLVGACLAKDPQRRPSSSDVLFRLLGMVGAEMPAGADPLERGATLVTTAITVDLPHAPPPPQLSQTAPPQSPPKRAPNRKPLMIGLPVALVALSIAVPTAIINLPTDGDGRGGSGATGIVKVGVMGPMTGDVAAFGTSALANARLAADEYNKTNPPARVQVVSLDTRGKPEIAASVARAAAGEGLAAVVGPILSGETQRAMPILEAATIPSVSPSAAAGLLSTQGWKHWHTMVPDVEEAVGALAALAGRTSGTAKVAVVEDEVVEPGKEGSRTAANMFTTRVQAAPYSKQVVRVSMRLPKLPRDGDYSATVKKLRDSKADAVFYGGFYDSAGPLVKQARAAGFTGRFYLSDGSFDKTFIQRAGSSAAEGAVLTCPCLDISTGTTGMPKTFGDYLARYAKANNGQKPGASGPEAYDAMTAILAAVKAGKRTGTEINGYLHDINVPGVTQRIRFKEQGQLTDSVSYAYQVRDGAFTFLGDSRTAVVR
ncbi:bifunctional serine/threonine-protein kinase/ABC transporter substrate-binding protein [Actinomadura rudentiformis]|uniref:ABC transporter substrate-binding protein n=1 Tax=Actinomadura rudentiformis TaxID=359158 RepID=A0A6H9YQL5_9ACTN|nr:bifunctional serine/threonine-protein kinase/ABC transporter substrate-binding protein [Actinomadura rudentiformis]KAB2343250.1 ABC transporter substrate-binding protein [Actinomadura rudentiformis]